MSTYGYAVYDTATGRIYRIVVCDDPMLDEQFMEPGASAVPVSSGVSDADYYIVDGEEVLRPTLEFDKLSIVADGIDVASLTGLPNPTTVRIDGVAYEITDGEFKFAADIPATYTIEIRDPFPYVAFKAEVTAT